MSAAAEMETEPEMETAPGSEDEDLDGGETETAAAGGRGSDCPTPESCVESTSDSDGAVEPDGNWRESFGAALRSVLQGSTYFSFEDLQALITVATRRHSQLRPDELDALKFTVRAFDCAKLGRCGPYASRSFDDHRLDLLAVLNEELPGPVRTNVMRVFRELIVRLEELLYVVL